MIILYLFFQDLLAIIPVILSIDTIGLIRFYYAISRGYIVQGLSFITPGRIYAFKKYTLRFISLPRLWSPLASYYLPFTEIKYNVTHLRGISLKLKSTKILIRKDYNNCFSSLSKRGFTKKSGKIIRRWKISSLDNIIFDEKTNTAVLLLPDLCDIFNKLESTDYSVDNFKDDLVKSDFFNDFLKIFSNLDYNQGYSLCFNFYGEYSGILPKSVFNLDLNKNIVNEMHSNYGYLPLSNKYFFHDPLEMTPERIRLMDYTWFINDRKEYFAKWLYKGLDVINFNNYKDKILLFIVKDINTVRYERKLINPVMEIYMFNLKPKSKSSAAYNDYWCKQTDLRFAHFPMPTNPLYFDDSIGMVIKDRNYTGKFKFSPDAKGIVTIFLKPDALCYYCAMTKVYGLNLLNTKYKSLFFPYLDTNVRYEVYIWVRKGIDNCMINNGKIYTDSSLIDFKQHYFSQFIFNIHKLMILFREYELNKYRHRINTYFYLKLVFIPCITHIDDNNEKIN